MLFIKNFRTNESFRLHLENTKMYFNFKKICLSEYGRFMEPGMVRRAWYYYNGEGEVEAARGY